MYCTACGTEFMNGARFCQSCGVPRTHRGKSVEQIESELHLVLPMGTPLSAIIAGYLGLFSVLMFPAPFALVTGFVGLAQIKKNGGHYGKVRCWVGIILGGIFTLLILWLIALTIIA